MINSGDCPLVSVVIPVFNGADYIEDAIDSVLEQSVASVEIIVVDDASTDQTGDVVRRKRDGKLSYFRLNKNHGGPSRPRNIGISLACGRYVALLDADDLMCPGHLERAVSFLEEHPALGLVFTDEIRFDDRSGTERGRFLDGYERFWSLPRLHAAQDQWVIPSVPAYETLFFENYIMPSGVTLPARVFENVGMFDESLTNGDDWDMWFRITEQYPVGFIRMPGFRYRMREGSISSRGALLAENRCRVIHKQFKKKQSPVLKKQCRLLLARNYFSMGYFFQAEANLSKARLYYLESLKKNLNRPALKGLLITLMGKRLYLRLKSIRVPT